MTDIAASDFRHPHRYVRLDTILRLRWLAALGQLAAIFIVAQGLSLIHIYQRRCSAKLTNRH